jgi:glycine/D-amino acid oxidase-like deaminating enzyme
MRSTDVVVVGLGVHGSAVAREFAARGWRVLGVEQSPGDEVWGASCGPLRMVREHDPHRPWLTELAGESVEQWQLLSGGQELFRRVSGVFVVTEEERQRKWLLSLERVAFDDPLLVGLALEDGWEYARDRACGLLDARASVLALRDGARALGAELVFGQQVELGETRPTGGAPVRVRIGDEDVVADRVLVCAGAWSAEMPDWARVPGLSVEPSHMQLATFGDGPALLDHDVFYVFYQGDERFCAIPRGPGWQFGHFSAPASANLMHPAELVRETRRRDLAALRRFFPGLGDVRQLSTVRANYTAPPDDALVLWWASPQVASLVACSGVGFKFAPAIARRVVAACEGHEVPRDGLRVTTSV